MTDYAPPLRDIEAVLDGVGADEVLAPASLDRGTVSELLAEFGRVAAKVIAPIDAVGDRVGSRLDPTTGAVTTPPGFAEAYRAVVHGGWNAPAAEVEHGGGGLPAVVAMAVQEMLTSASMALSLCPMLTQGAVELLAASGDERQRRLFLPRLVTGEWTGTMNLTEPDAGSDVGAVRARAEQDADGRWRVSGTKVFITWGEHDLAENIVHLVLARTPGAPPGTKGLSLFLVPKFDVAPDGSLGARNSVRCLKLEEKLGIHASPTCVLEFTDAVGELVGDVCDGMRGMFVMMNAARRAVGVEGLAVAERALQQSEAYAAERRQGRAPGAPPGSSSPIAQHPDVARMLLTMRSSVAGMRHLLYFTAKAADDARYAGEVTARERALARLDLLTPVAKAWATDTGVAMASLAIQVHGGLGYIEESGVPQRLRDSRIAPIYEGTNGIQAVDLVTRKVRRDKGATLALVVDEAWRDVATAPAELRLAADLVSEALRTLERATDWIVARSHDEVDEVLAGATAYLELCGIVLSGWLLLRSAHTPEAVRMCTFYATEVVARAVGLLVPITAGAVRLQPVGG
ncbi:MAG TPA: acyl-CoA dehydrogenase [Acidimicrobiales bacterium]|nr:acyl-CoA dehydrogenase [Acidimicrobiales bacterium]